MITFFDLLVVAGIVACAYWGWLVGLEVASVAALELVACLSVAAMLHEAVAGFLLAGFALILGDWVSQAWAILLAFAGLAWGSFALLRLQVHRRRSPDGDDDDDEEQADIDPLTDRLAGAVAGGFGGAVLVGGALVTLSMVPFLAGLKPSGDRMLLDVGKTALRAAGQFATERHEGRSLPLWGEPPSRVTVPSALLSSEPWFDVDDDGACTDVDRFRDVDGNGTFTKDLYFVDVDADGFRRVGLVDKYVAGRWDAALMSNDRPRPDLQKPAPEPAKPARPAPPPPAPTRPKKPEADAAKPAEPKPVEPKPADTKPMETKPAGGKPAPATSPDAATVDTKPTEGKPGADTPPPTPSGGKRPGDDF